MKLPRRARSPLLAAACLALAAASARSQTCSDLGYGYVGRPIGGYSWCAAAADWNGDGAEDFAVGYRVGTAVSLFLNQGDGSFASSTSIGVGLTASSLAAGDLDGDGEVDLVAAGRGAAPASDGLVVLLGDGSGGFSAQPAVGLGGLGSDPARVRLGDLDGDGDLDALVLIDYPGGVLAFLNDGAGGLSSTGTPLPAGYGARNLAVADFDGDQRLDCAALTGNVGTTLTVGWGRGDGTFEPASTTYPANVYGGGLEAGDFTGDGAPDLVSGHKYGINLYTYQGGRSFSTSTTLIGYYNKGLACADLDGDGTLDLAATFGSGGVIRFLSGSGGGSFSPIDVQPAGVQAYALALGDWNGDGLPDAVSADYDGNQVRIWTASCALGTYCTAKPNSQGCVPAISVSGPPLTISAANVLNNKFGILFYGHAAAELPFQGGTLCVAPPLVRTPPMLSGGNPPPDDCSGAYVFDFDAWVQSGRDRSLVPGAHVYAQFWSRDPDDPSGTGLTDAAQFTLP